MLKNASKVIDTSSLGIIPRAHPEELNNISLCDRLNRLEARMQSMQVTMDNSIAKNLQLEEKIVGMNSYASVLSRASFTHKQEQTSGNSDRSTVSENMPIPRPSGSPITRPKLLRNLKSLPIATVRSPKKDANGVCVAASDTHPTVKE